MLRRAPSGLATVLATALACTGPEPTTAPELDLPVNTAIADAAQGGESHFYWLPPIAPATPYGGTFDGTVSPELRICRLGATGCETLIATYTRSSSPSIAVSTTSQAYSLVWSTKPASITTGDYRAEVWVANRRLGFADASVVASAKDLKIVGTGFVGVQKGKTLSFNFRLEAGIVASISIAPPKPTVQVGAAAQLTATVRDVHGAVITGTPVTWATSPASVATVSAAGLVTGVSQGKASVSATIGAVSTVDTITVAPAQVAEVVVNPSGESVFVGQTVQLWATVYDARGTILTGRAVTWSSSDAGVATVSATGAVTGVAPGSATITATSEGVAGNTAVNVTPAPVARVEIAPPSDLLPVGQTRSFSATTYDASDAVLTGRPVAWETSDTSVVTVTPNGGLVGAVGPGIAIVSATSEGVTASVRVLVTGPTVTCLRPWALPAMWFLAEPYGRAIRARYGPPNEFGVVPPGTISGNYYALTLGASGAAQYFDNVVACSQTPVTLGTLVPLSAGNLVGTTLQALDSLFALDHGATWDSTANEGRGGIVSSNAPDGTESPRVVQVLLYEDRDQSPGAPAGRFRRTAWVFVDTYSRETNWDRNEVIGDIVFRFLRFGP